MPTAALIGYSSIRVENVALRICRCPEMRDWRLVYMCTDLDILEQAPNLLVEFILERPKNYAQTHSCLMPRRQCAIHCQRIRPAALRRSYCKLNGA